MHPIRFTIRVPGTFLCSGRRAYLLVLLSLAFPLYAAETTEHRRALLINASADPAHARDIATLGKTLESKGFVVTHLADARHTGGLAYEKWLRAIPTLSASILYYCGELDTVKSNDGKRTHYAMQIGGHDRLPPTTRPTGRERPEEHPLSTARLSQVLSDNTARDQLVLIDCLGIADTINTGSDQATLMKSAQGSTKGHFHAVFYPGSEAYHPSRNDEPVVFGPVLAGELTQALHSGKDLLSGFGKLAFKASPRYNNVFALRYKPAQVCAPPDQLREGRFAGDQWVDPLGICWVWCPAGRFSMGDAQFPDAQPVEVTLSKGYWIGKYELLARENIPLGGGPTLVNERSDGSKHRWLPNPASQLFTATIQRFYDWQAYQQESGQAFDGWSYDLPTEAEWEYACRAGSKAPFPCAIKDLGQYGNFADLSLYNDRSQTPYLYACREADDGFGRTVADAGSFRPNAWGIHDMRGNLAELCADLFNPELLGGTDPLDHRFELGRDFRSLPIGRGGCWSSPPEYLHAAHRNPKVSLRQFEGVTPLAVDGVRLVIRKGERRSRSGDELMQAAREKN